MSAAQGVERTSADRLGIKPGMFVMEMGYDSDADADLRDAVVDRSGEDLLDTDSDEIVDAVLLWHRETDEDLVDRLMDALGPLGDEGVVWVLTPKPGRAGHVPASDISEAAPSAGLTQTSSISASQDWSGVRLVPPKAGRRR